MHRYFIELSYKGTHYSGFQKQENAVTVQEKVEDALRVFFRKDFALTGSSRTDAGVHANQNYFHFDSEETFDQKHIYNLNAILPADIVIKNIMPVASDAHARFNATSRHYRYCIYKLKNPFLNDRGWYLPFKLDIDSLHCCAALICNNQNFIAFSKVHTQVKTFDCRIKYSRWVQEDDCLYYEVSANRFLRGMVRGLVGTMIKVARGNLSTPNFEALLKGGEVASADFSAPAKGLFLDKVAYPDGVFLSESL
jgi:tRNA pseudouridine38-40 synthase